MSDSNIAQQESAPAGTQLDWNALASALGTNSVEETQRKAYDIAKFVADVESDKDSELILKTGSQKMALKLNR